MSTNKEQFVIDESGNKTAVLMEVDRYAELIEAQEELESIRAYDEAKTSNDEAIPFTQPVKEIASIVASGD
jgi:PHD/YefM family antitoxin component YafN of YafNO toxin-antitoxin module